MSPLKKYDWEITHLASTTAIIAVLAVVTHLTGTPRIKTPNGWNVAATGPKSTSSSPSVPAQPSLTDHPAQPSFQHAAVRPEQSDPREVVVGAYAISNRYKLLSVDRKPVSSTVDELIVRLHVESLAMDPFSSPFESEMLGLVNQDRDLTPITPKTPFHHPVPAGYSLNKDIVFNVPTSLDLAHTSLQIHYYNYQREIPLNLPPRKVVQ